MKKHDASRRKALKTLGLTGGLGAAGFTVPKQWVSPMVSTVVLPAHAGTSTSGTFRDNGVALLSQNFSPLDMLVPVAHAWSFITADVCIDIYGGAADVFVRMDPSAGDIVLGKLNISFPFDYIELKNQGDGCPGGLGATPRKYSLSAQLQVVNGVNCIVGNIRENTAEFCVDPQEYNYYPYVAKPADGGCGLSISPPV